MDSGATSITVTENDAVVGTRVVAHSWVTETFSVVSMMWALYRVVSPQTSPYVLRYKAHISRTLRGSAGTEHTVEDMMGTSWILLAGNLWLYTTDRQRLQQLPSSMFVTVPIRLISNKVASHFDIRNRMCK